MMKKEIFYNTSELINKGWTQDKVNYFLLKKYGKKEVWSSKVIEEIERKEKFIKF